MYLYYLSNTFPGVESPRLPVYTQVISVSKNI